MNGYSGTAVPPGGMYVRALYDYDADDRTSLSFKQGDIIQVSLLLLHTAGTGQPTQAGRPTAPPMAPSPPGVDPIFSPQMLNPFVSRIIVN